MKSRFQFVGYKVDRLSLKVYPTLEIIEAMDFDSDWKIELNVRRPAFYTEKKIYLGGVGCTFKKISSDLETREEIELVAVEASIVGTFKVDGKFDEEKTETLLVFHQMPTILFPYLRGTITSLLANAGIGSVIVPLINMNVAARNALEGQTVEVLP